MAIIDKDNFNNRNGIVFNGLLNLRISTTSGESFDVHCMGKKHCFSNLFSCCGNFGVFILAALRFSKDILMA
jgi:hypothetical protein